MPKLIKSKEEIKAEAIANARKGGLKGGPARAAALTPERRKEISTKATKARWGGLDWRWRD